MNCIRCHAMITIDDQHCPHCNHFNSLSHHPYGINLAKKPINTVSVNEANNNTAETPQHNTSETAQTTPNPPISDEIKATIHATQDSVVRATHVLTEKLGLDRIEGFSLKRFFSGILQKRSTEEIENYVSVGFQSTTPLLNPSMASLPSPWLFFRVLIGGLIAYLVFYITYKQFPSNTKLIPGLIVTGTFAVPLAMSILFFELNTPRNVSLFKLIQMLIFGGGISIFITLILFSAFPFLEKSFGASASGLIEEIAKLATVILLTKLPAFSVNRYRHAINGLLFGAIVGAGFAAFESAGYALSIGLQSGADALLSNITSRAILTPFSHVIWTAISTCAFWRIRRLHNNIQETIKDQRFLLIAAIPMTLHFIWNSPIPDVWFLKHIALGLVGWIVVLSLVNTSLKEIANDPTVSQHT